MPRIRKKVIVNGEEKWITGNSQQELFDRYAELFTAGERKQTPLFEQYSSDWLRIYKEPKLRSTTLKSYKTLLRLHIVPFFGERHLPDITTQDIQAFFNERSDMSRSSLRQMHVILEQILDSAIEDGYVQANPARSKRLSYSKKVSARMPLSAGEYRDILSHLDKLDRDDRTLVALLAMTGMRRGEVLALKWRNIDFENNLIHVESSITFSTNQGTEGDPKSNAGIREIPLPSSLRPYLPGGEAGDYVVGGSSHYTESKFDRAWQRISRKIDMHGATPHILRHTYLTLLGTTDTPVKTLQAIAGHADIRMTMNRYVHKELSSLQKAGTSVDIFVDKYKFEKTQ